MSFVIGFLTGSTFGGCFGVFVVALCVAAQREKTKYPGKPESWEVKP